MPCTGLFFFAWLWVSKKENVAVRSEDFGVRFTHEERRPCSTGHTCRLQKGTHNDCFSCFDLSTVFQMDKEWFVLYTQDIWREREMEIINAHGPKKYTCQQKHAKCNMHFIHLVLINLLFRGKHECLGRQLLWPFSVLGIFCESLFKKKKKKRGKKRLSLWQQEASRQTWEEVWESRESLSALCFRDARHVFGDLSREELFHMTFIQIEIWRC